jgi:hypothetical protein
MKSKRLARDSKIQQQLSFLTKDNLEHGFPLAEPAYVKKVREENAKPIPFPASYKTQLSLFDAPAPAPVKEFGDTRFVTVLHGFRVHRLIEQNLREAQEEVAA